MCLLGAEFMVVDRLVLADTVSSTKADPVLDSIYGASTFRSGSASYPSATVGSVHQHVYVPPEWAPWGFLSAGVLTVLYGAAIPQD